MTDNAWLLGKWLNSTTMEEEIIENVIYVHLNFFLKVSKCTVQFEKRHLIEDDCQWFLEIQSDFLPDNSVYYIPIFSIIYSTL